jgi:hypothetical protein
MLPLSISTIVVIIFSFELLGSCTNTAPRWFPAVLPKPNAKLEAELPFSFELVLKTWESGPKEPQFLRLMKLPKFIGYFHFLSNAGVEF